MALNISKLLSNGVTANYHVIQFINKKFSINNNEVRVRIKSYPDNVNYTNSDDSVGEFGFVWNNNPINNPYDAVISFDTTGMTDNEIDLRVAEEFIISNEIGWNTAIRV